MKFQLHRARSMAKILANQRVRMVRMSQLTLQYEAARKQAVVEICKPIRRYVHRCARLSTVYRLPAHAGTPHVPIPQGDTSACSVPLGNNFWIQKLQYCHHGGSIFPSTLLLLRDSSSFPAGSATTVSTTTPQRCRPRRAHPCPRSLTSTSPGTPISITTPLLEQPTSFNVLRKRRTGVSPMAPGPERAAGTAEDSTRPSTESLRRYLGIWKMMGSTAASKSGCTWRRWWDLIQSLRAFRSSGRYEEP